MVNRICLAIDGAAECASSGDAESLKVEVVGRVEQHAVTREEPRREVAAAVAFGCVRAVP